MAPLERVPGCNGTGQWYLSDRSYVLTGNSLQAFDTILRHDHNLSVYLYQLSLNFSFNFMFYSQESNSWANFFAQLFDSVSPNTCSFSKRARISAVGGWNSQYGWHSYHPNVLELPMNTGLVFTFFYHPSYYPQLLRHTVVFWTLSKYVKENM